MSDINWHPIETYPEYATVMFYHHGDLYPVIGSLWRGEGRDLIYLEEAGDAGSECRTYRHPTGTI